MKQEVWTLYLTQDFNRIRSMGVNVKEMQKPIIAF